MEEGLVCVGDSRRRSSFWATHRTLLRGSRGDSKNEWLLGGGVRLGWEVRASREHDVVVLHLGFLGNGKIENVFCFVSIGMESSAVVCVPMSFQACVMAGIGAVVPGARA